MDTVSYLISLTFLSLVSAYWETTEPITEHVTAGTTGYTAGSIQACGSSERYFNGTIESPNFSGYYSYPAHCTWNLHVGRNKAILLDYESVHLESWSSYVTVYDGIYSTNILVRTTANTGLPYKVVSTSNTMRIEFYSNRSGSRNQFKVTFSEIDRIEMTTSSYKASSEGGKMALAHGTRFRLNGHRLEVDHNGRWGTVCDDGFDERTAREVCYLVHGERPTYARFYNTQYSSGQGKDLPVYQILLDQLECKQSYYYYVPECSANYWGDNDCTHSEDVYIDCIYPNQVSTLSSEVTTMDYDSSTWGGQMSIPQGTRFRLNDQRLEVYHNGRWGTVCDDGFTQRTSRDICKLIYGKWPSYSTYKTQPYSAEQTTTPPLSQIWLDQLQCRNTIYNGVECRANNWGVNDCSHSEDVSIECYFTGHNGMTTVSYDSSPGGAITIDKGTSFRLDGQRLEVHHNGRWGTVCDDGFTPETTRIICKSIYGEWPSYQRFYNQQSIGQNTISPSYQIWLDQLQCRNTLYYGIMCSANHWGVNDCSHDEDVFIECQFSNHYEYTTEYNTATAAMNSAAPHYSSDMYVSSITVGCDPGAWNIMIYLPDLYKRHSDFDPSDIYLGRPGCQGYRYGNYLRIDQQYSNCDTYHFMTTNTVEYTNTLVYAYRDANYKFIIRDYRFRIDVHCDMATHETVSQHFIQTHNQVRMRSSNPQISNTGHYNIRMAFYRDSGYQQQIYGNPLTVHIREDIYVSVTTPLSDYDVKMSVETCYTLPSPGAGDKLKLYLIKNGCTSDVSAHIIYRSSHETRFVFRDFEYSVDQDNLYLFCTAKFCNVTDYSSACDQSCHRIKRETVQSASEAHVKRAETSDVLRLSKGRSRRDVRNLEDTETSGHAQYISVDDHLFIAVIVSAVGISMIAIFVAIRRYRKPRSKPIDTI